MRFVVLFLLIVFTIGVASVAVSDQDSFTEAIKPWARMARCSAPVIISNLELSGFKIGSFKKLFKRSAAGLGSCGVDEKLIHSLRAALEEFFEKASRTFGCRARGGYKRHSHVKPSN